MALIAVSDLHVEHRENREAVEHFLRPGSSDDWLLIAGDVANSFDRIEWALSLLQRRFARVIWVPGNHELHCHKGEPAPAPRRYELLVDLCNSLSVITPESPYPVWHGPDGPFRIIPLFLLYDYSFGTLIANDPGEALELAYKAGIVCDDEFLLKPEPYVNRATWCVERVAQTERRLEQLDGMPTVFVNHFPLHIDPTKGLLRREFAQWCGTTLTSDWHTRFKAAAVVFGHLHIPRTSWLDGVPFEEVSFGYPRQWQCRSPRGLEPRQILPRCSA